MKIQNIYIKSLLKIFLNIFFFITLWELICNILNIPDFLLPAPSKIAQTVLLIKYELLVHTWTTSLETGLGFLLGSTSGILLGIACSLSKTLEKAILPYAIGIKTIPIVAIAPLLTIWFGTSIISKTILSALICFFPVLINTLRGLKNIEIEHLYFFRSLAASEWQIFWLLRWKNALPSIFSGLKISVVFAVTGAIVAEFAGAKSGIGFCIMMASYQLEVPKMFVYIIISILIGLNGYFIVSVIEKLCVPWREQVEKNIY